MNSLAALLSVIIIAIDIIVWLVIVQAILSWLVAFNVVNLHNNFVRTVLTTLDRLLDPLLRPIRRVLPDLGGIDLSPMVLILLLILIQRLLPALLLDAGAI
jgi:YggT family protein